MQLRWKKTFEARSEHPNEQKAQIHLFSMILLLFFVEIAAFIIVAATSLHNTLHFKESAKIIHLPYAHGNKN